MKILNFFKKTQKHKDHDEIEFENGYKKFHQDGEYDDSSYLSMVNLFCKTNGEYLDFKQLEISRNNPPVDIEGDFESILGNLTKEQFQNINDTLVEDGYVFFDIKLSKEIITGLVEFALNTPCKYAPDYNESIIYNPNKIKSEIYRFDLSDLVSNEFFQRLIMDQGIINIARNYLRSEPIFDFPALWWSTNYLKKPSDEAAQLYHFDLDRIKWLKIFVYLTDVSDENGPHYFVKGTHKSGAKSLELLKRGYVRIPDFEIENHYDSNKIIKVCAEAGTIFAGDTKCWHKGSQVFSGHRLLLELEYTSDTFGANVPMLNVKNSSEEFKNFCLKHPFYTQRINFL